MGAVYREELSANARKLIEQLLSLPQGLGDGGGAG